MNHVPIVKKFCTPAEQIETEFDKKVYAEAGSLEVNFEDRILKVYSIGTGKTVILVHGWNSRASHLTLLARSLAKKGFHVVIFDGPAHGYSRKDTDDMTNLFEFVRSISCVAKQMGDIYSIIGHSFGGLAAAFSLLGTGPLSEYRISSNKLILISSPQGMSSVIKNYCRDNKDIENDLIYNLEKSFNFSIADYDLSTKLNLLHSDILIIHDEQDEEIPVSNAHNLKAANSKSKLFITKGSGHDKILINRDMLRQVNEFLME